MADEYLRGITDRVPSASAVKFLKGDSEDQSYLVWSHEHGAWWGPGSCGYKKGLQDAGRYTREQALAICRHAIPTSGHLGTISEIPVRYADVREFMDGQMIPAAMWHGRR